MQHRYHWLTHIAIGIVLVTFLRNQFPIGLLIGGFVIFVSMSSAPDVDIALPIKHRGFSHTLLATVLVGLVGFYVVDFIGGPGVFFGATIGLGYGMHILEDMFTTGGVKFLWPLTGLSISFTPFRHDSVFFTFFAWAALFSALGYMLHILEVVNMIEILHHLLTYVPV